MKNVLVDTDILINFLRGKTKARSCLFLLLEDFVVYCSAITVAEILSGMKECEAEKTTELIDSLNVVDVT